MPVHPVVRRTDAPNQSPFRTKLVSRNLKIAGNANANKCSGIVHPLGNINSQYSKNTVQAHPGLRVYAVRKQPVFINCPVCICMACTTKHNNAPALVGKPLKSQPFKRDGSEIVFCNNEPVPGTFVG